MELYPYIKLVHITTVIVSFILFSARFILLLKQSALLQQRWLKIIPHVNDTVLLFSAVSLAWIAGLIPGPDNPWLLAKIIAMLCYIASGFMLFKLDTSKLNRMFIYTAATLIYIYIIHTAISHRALPF